MSSSSFTDPDAFIDPEDPEVVREAKRNIIETSLYPYTERDIILYNLSIGATEQELQWIYEGHEDFAPIPTFGVIPQLPASSAIALDWLPNFNPARIVHAEMHLSIKAPLPPSGVLVNTARITEVLDKGIESAVVTSIIQTRDQESGDLIYENQSTIMIRNSGGFMGKRQSKNSKPVSIPKREPDVVVEEKTIPTQAALYRLNGDINPLHISQDFATFGGFDKPILHGACSMGIAGKHIWRTFGPYKDIRVRFAGIVYPGETLITEMWKERSKVFFRVRVKERNSIALDSSLATLEEEEPSENPRAKL